MKPYKIDINCDVGEGIGNESELLPLISSCNIACGGHAGDSNTIEQVLVLAKKYNVKVGAHPSYPDRENFGRVSISMPKNDFVTAIQEQMSRFTKAIESTNMRMHHIKPHGALYTDIAKDKILADTFLQAIMKYKESVFLYVPYASIIEQLAVKQGFQVKREAFADRNYCTDLSLVSRKLNHAVLTDPKKVLVHLITMVKNLQVRTENGTMKGITADTYCIHGDTSSALQILTYLTSQLPTHNIEIVRE